MLDEIDKIGHDFRVGSRPRLYLKSWTRNRTTPSQITIWRFPTNLSKVMFIATANVGDTIPAPLKDRMEIIEIPGYTRREKLDIAKNHLLLKQIEEHGVSDCDITIGDAALEGIIDHYTREAGVRNLERQLASVIRGIAVKVAEGEKGPFAVDDEEALRPYLGPPRFSSEVAERTEETGVATGLAWTAVGGEILFHRSHPHARLRQAPAHRTTWRSMMKESAQAALSYVRSRAKQLAIPEDFLEKHDIHIHIPAGAMPKDGPSGGCDDDDSSRVDVNRHSSSARRGQ